MDIFNKDMNEELQFFQSINEDSYPCYSMLGRDKSTEARYQPFSFNGEKFTGFELPKDERCPLEFDLDRQVTGNEEGARMEEEDLFYTGDCESGQIQENRDYIPMEEVEHEHFNGTSTDLSAQSEAQDFESAETETVVSEIQTSSCGVTRGCERKVQSERSEAEQFIFEKLLNFFKYGIVNKADLLCKKSANLYTLPVLKEKLFSLILLPLLLESPEEARKDASGRAYLHKKRGDQFQKKFHSKWRDYVYYSKEFKVPGVTREMAYEKMLNHFEMVNNDAFQRIFGSKIKMGLENKAVETMLTNGILFREFINASVVLAVVHQLHEQTQSDIETNFMGHVRHLLKPNLSEKDREAYVEEHLNKNRTVKKPFMYSENYKAAQAFVDKLQTRVKKTGFIASKGLTLNGIQEKIESEMERLGFSTEKAKGKGRKSKDLASFVRVV